MVEAMPRKAKHPSNRFLMELRSATAPRKGAMTATRIPARELARPSLAVLRAASAPAFQNCLNMTGKNPAITVVAKAELAQSYRAHARTLFREPGSIACPLLGVRLPRGAGGEGYEDAPFFSLTRYAFLMSTGFSGTSWWNPLFPVATASMASTTSMPLITLPNTQ